jgi:hypothetical protein
VTARQLRTSAFCSREELADALQGLFVAELLVPSHPLWLVTPWVSDVELVDNRSARFSGLLPGLPARWIRLAELLEHQLVRGGSIVVACRPDPHNESFTRQLDRRAAECGRSSNLRIRHAVDLHEKGILTKDLLVSGSMNLTYNGIHRLEESINLVDDADVVARTRVAYEDRWGAP